MQKERLMPMYQALSCYLDDFEKCIKAKNIKEIVKHKSRLNNLFNRHPEFNGNIELNIEPRRNNRKIVFIGRYHIFSGLIYEGPINFTATITANLSTGYDLEVRGQFSDYENGENLKNYIAAVLIKAMETEINYKSA